VVACHCWRALGVIGFFVPRVLGVGYETISDILNNRLPLIVLLSVMVSGGCADHYDWIGHFGSLLAPCS